MTSNSSGQGFDTLPLSIVHSSTGNPTPTLVALGTPTFDILNRNLSDRYKIIKIRHYAFRENKEKYRDHVEEVCAKYL